MDIKVNRDQFAAIARDASRPGTYMQILDRIARAVGYDNNAAMMTRLNAPEKAPEPKPEPVTVVLALGRSASSAIRDGSEIGSVENQSVISRTFDTEKEAEAFLRGAELAVGSYEIEVAACSGERLSKNPDFFEARGADPGLSFSEWHNGKTRSEPVEP